MEKELAIHNFKVMIEQSWTYEKMTREEKDNWERVLNSIQTLDSVKGSYNNRWKVLQAIYNSYLLGLGYNGFAWREEE
jgi:hypothetical protein